MEASLRGVCASAVVDQDVEQWLMCVVHRWKVEAGDFEVVKL